VRGKDEEGHELRPPGGEEQPVLLHAQGLRRGSVVGFGFLVFLDVGFFLGVKFCLASSDAEGFRGAIVSLVTNSFRAADAGRFRTADAGRFRTADTGRFAIDAREQEAQNHRDLAEWRR
jgi:hypothetical protein